MRNEFRSGLSRRSFLRGAGAASVAAASLPGFAAVQGMGAPKRSRGPADSDVRGPGGLIEDDVITISMNENPLGPAQSSLDALTRAASAGNRYHGEMVQQTVSTAMDRFGMKRGYVGLFPGSTGAMNLALMSNLGPDQPLVYGDPSYELGADVADMVGAEKFPVKLTAKYAHDVRAMVAATPKVGAYYIVNPNNPTGTMTPKADIVWLLKNKPAGSVVIVDEAYHDLLERRIVHRPGGGEPRHHRDAYVFQDLRHGWIAGGAGVCAAGLLPEVPGDRSVCAEPGKCFDHQCGGGAGGAAG